MLDVIPLASGRRDNLPTLFFCLLPVAFPRASISDTASRWKCFYISFWYQMALLPSSQGFLGIFRIFVSLLSSRLGVAALLGRVWSSGEKHLFRVGEIGLSLSWPPDHLSLFCSQFSQNHLPLHHRLGECL